MTGATYPRTQGRRLVRGTWAYVEAHADLAAEALKPDERTQYDVLPADKQTEWRGLEATMQPPDFLRFALAVPFGPDADVLADGYPGAVEAAFAHPEMGRLPAGRDAAEVAMLLGITQDALKVQLGKFAGQVAIHKLTAGTRLYRTVGLIADCRKDELAGYVTNRLLGDYWDIQPPSEYESIAEWRGMMAVLAEWNGDFGFVEITLKHDVVVLEGTVGRQSLAGASGRVLPGGGRQVYIPRLTNADLEAPIDGRPLKDVIQETQFKGGIDAA